MQTQHCKTINIELNTILILQTYGILHAKWSKLKPEDLYGALHTILVSRVLRYGTQFYCTILPATLTFNPQVEWAIAAFTSQPQSITALLLVLIFHHTKGRRLSWAQRLATYQDGIPANSHPSQYWVALAHSNFADVHNPVTAMAKNGTNEDQRASWLYMAVKI